MMKRLKKILIALVVLLLAGYIALCVWFYTGQEKALFTRVPHPADYAYRFDVPFEEKNITMPDGKRLNGVIFKADSAKGVVLWLPGGRGMLDSLSEEASYYTRLQYDVCIINYRGFGKSEGSITSEAQFNSDMQTVYDSCKAAYGEDRMIVYGYSLGTGPAANLAANNHPRMLLLLAPYYSLLDMTQKSIPYLPMSLLMKYHFPTAEALAKTSCPVVIFHGDADQTIKPEASQRLKAALKPTDQLIILPGQQHNHFTDNPQFLAALEGIL